MNKQTPENHLEQVLHEYCEEIVRCMVVYGGWTEAKSRERLDESGLCSPELNLGDNTPALLFHEFPYFWAMGLIHRGSDPQWFKDPNLKLWPPPVEAEQFWVTHEFPPQLLGEVTS